MPASVTLCTPTMRAGLENVLRRYGLRIELITGTDPIPGSYWGDSEAGLVGDALYVREDTPLHSALHEACHYICMDDVRRAELHTDAGGDDVEESAVCYLQGLLADEIGGYDRVSLFTDMDLWGYSFRLGSARAWFDEDADDARDWLLSHRLVDGDMHATWRLRR